MFRRAAATIALSLSVSGAALLAAAPVASADEPPPLFNVPVEILPYIEVPQWLHDPIVSLGYGVNDAIVGFNNANDGIVRGLSGALGGVLCAMAAGSSNPCAPTP